MARRHAAKVGGPSSSFMYGVMFRLVTCDVSYARSITTSTKRVRVRARLASAATRRGWQALTHVRAPC